MERDCWIERFWPGSHTGVLGWSGSLVGTFVGTDVSGREDESSSVFCGLFYMNVDQVSLRSGRGLHAPDFIVYQAAWGSQWSRSLTRSFPALVLVSIRSGLGSRLYHDNESINNVLNTDSFQCWLSACICVSRILKTGCKSGSFLHPAGKILYCFTGKQDWSSNRKARESVRFPGHKNSNILPWRPLTHTSTLHSLSGYKTRSLCVEVRHFFLFCSLFCCLCPCEDWQQNEIFHF